MSIKEIETGIWILSIAYGFSLCAMWFVIMNIGNRLRAIEEKIGINGNVQDKDK